jgi:hypothetical protein
MLYCQDDKSNDVLFANLRAQELSSTCGVLYVRVHEGRDLKVMDRTG